MTNPPPSYTTSWDTTAANLRSHAYLEGVGRSNRLQYAVVSA